VIFHRREFSKRIGATVELSLRGSHHPSLKNYTGLDISQGRDKKICGTTFGFINMSVEIEKSTMSVQEENFILCLPGVCVLWNAPRIKPDMA